MNVRNISVFASVMLHLFCKIYCEKLSFYVNDNVAKHFWSGEPATHVELCRLSGMCIEDEDLGRKCCMKCRCEQPCNIDIYSRCCPDFIQIDS